MSVPLPPISGGTVQPEFAATNIGFTRSVKSIEGGSIVAVFTASLSYQRTDYLLNSSGQKVGIVNSEIGLPQDPLRYGNIYLDANKTEVLFETVPPAGEPLGVVIANMADELIHEDLVARGIITV